MNFKYFGVNNSVIQFPFTKDFKESHFAFRPENKSLPLQAYTTFLRNNSYVNASDIDRIVAEHVSICNHLTFFLIKLMTNINILSLYTTIYYKKQKYFYFYHK